MSTLGEVLPDVQAHRAVDVLGLDPADIERFIDCRDVLALVGSDASHEARDRVRRAVEHLGDAPEELLRSSYSGRSLRFPVECDTPGSRLAWLRNLPAWSPRSHIKSSAIQDEDDTPLPETPWPDPPGPDAYHGLVGKAVRAVAEHTEADPAAILAQLLVAFGNAVGRSPHMLIDGSRHGVNEYLIVVGETAAARKGTSKARALSFLDDVDPDWRKYRIRNGLSSGEGLICPVRDPTLKNGEVVDPGEIDKRLLVIESEFGSVLRALQREGNRLSALLRSAWDGDDLATMTRTPLRATEPHISIIGHITFGELRALLSAVDISNGLANRATWLCARRSQVLPFGGNHGNLSSFRTRFQEAVENGMRVGLMALSTDARNLFAERYPALSTPPPGVLGEVLSRAPAHVLRWAMTYALLDCSALVREEHVLAGLAIVEASHRSAAFIFGERLGDPMADKVLAALRASPSGLTRSEIREHVLGKNSTAIQRGETLAMLLRHGLATVVREPGPGRPTTRYLATAPGVKALRAISPPERPLIALNALPPTPGREIFEL